MKIVISEGGPLIGFDRRFAHIWSGIWGKRFIGESSPYASDYEGLDEVLGSQAGPLARPTNIAKIPGSIVDGLLITMPFETAIIESTGNSVYLAQVEYSETSWTFSSVQRSYFDRAKFFDNEIHFYSEETQYIFFDAAYPAEKIRDDFITFDLDAGMYVFSSAIYNPDELTGLILYKINRMA